MTMKKNLRLSVFLLALVVLLSVLSVTALAGEKAPFEVIKLTGEDSNGTAGETLFTSFLTRRFWFPITLLVLQMFILIRQHGLH